MGARPTTGTTQRLQTALIAAALAVFALPGVHSVYAADAAPPVPLLKQGEKVDWWFVFKFNAASFPACGGNAKRVCIFGGDPQEKYGKHFSQQFVYASSADATLRRGSGCAGNTVRDPLGATFEEVYDHDYYYVIWNDQFYNDPKIRGCGNSCGAPWAHSKGMVAWNDAGDGLVLQVTTPSWPAAGSKKHPRRTDGNTLGCIKDNDVKVSQHFFALKLNKDDLIKVLKALKNASVVTLNDPNNQQVVRNGGPPDVQALVDQMGMHSDSMKATMATLSSGVVLISKPSDLKVPPWQMVSSLLGGIDLRTATWWMNPRRIPTTTPSSQISCWNSQLKRPGTVEIATTGHWSGEEIGLQGGSSDNRNHAKIGVSMSRGHDDVIFGDMNQQGSLRGPDCRHSQNGRGGLFYVLNDKPLADSVRALLKGNTAPTRPIPH